MTYSLLFREVAGGTQNHDDGIVLELYGPRRFEKLSASFSLVEAHTSRCHE